MAKKACFNDKEELRIENKLIQNGNIVGRLTYFAARIRSDIGFSVRNLNLTVMEQTKKHMEAETDSRYMKGTINHILKMDAGHGNKLTLLADAK